MPVVGKPRKFFKKFKFVVEVDNVAVAAFTKAGPLEVEVAVVEQYEGGTLIPEQEPGRAKFSELTLMRGACDDLDMWNWMKQVVDAAANAGLATPEYKRNMDIVQQERDGRTLRRWRIYDAWPKKFKAGDWDNDADENVIEEAVLVYRYFEPVK